jgi:tetratricopeptide (TPR) repeat protein
MRQSGKSAVRVRLPWRALVLGLSLTVLAAAARDPNPVIQQAAKYIEWGRYKQARSLLAEAVAKPDNGHNAALIAYYGHILAEFGDLHQSLKLTQRAVKLDPQCASCRLYLFESMARRAKHENHFRALLALPKMKKQLETADRLDPQLGDVQWGWIDLDLALPRAAGGGADSAIAHAQRLLKIDPVDGRLALGSIYEKTGKAEQALSEYRAAAREHPNDPRGLFALGQALFEQHQHAAAGPYLAQALALNARSALYAAYQAANLVYLNHLKQARDVIEAARQRFPDSRLADYLVAQALKDVGQDYAWARQLLEAYLRVPPEPQQPSAAEAKQLLAHLG